MTTNVNRPTDASMASSTIRGVRDRYTRHSGPVQLTGIQALARLPLDQHRRDLGRGLETSTFVSGYEGSPLAGLDLELGRIRDLLDSNSVVFQPALNEEAAATAIQGSQLLGSYHDATRDGVVGIWYGKAPGLDRACDAIRHGNLMGADPHGGVVLLVGDDPAAKSSSVPCASEMSLADMNIPTLYPADSQDILLLGQHAIELSRASGLWTALKIVTNVADGSGPVELGRDEPTPNLPEHSGRHKPTANLLQPTLGPLERELVTTRLSIAREYARLNELNPVFGRAAGDRVGIIAGGRTWQDTMAALKRLGIEENRLAASPVRVLKLGMIWPLEPSALVEFAAGLDEIVVVEEKRGFLEVAVRDALYGNSNPPVVSGKSDPDGEELFPAYGELDLDAVLPRLARRLQAHLELTEGAVRSINRAASPLGTNGRRQLPLAVRTPYFCSGCPHNTSTAISSVANAEEVLTGAGIGCHAMVLLMDDAQVGTVTGLSQMGGEGLQWIGMSPFIKRQHYVQNIGDGTFDHSGSLAIRAAVASGVNITYKVLYNSAVAMTGGQAAVGGMDVTQIVRVLLAEQVARIIVTTEDLNRYKKVTLPKHVAVWDRSRIDEAMQILSQTTGVTVLIHDQECATEKRRRRKRTQASEPHKRVFINERVCEGCGDCGRKSNCLSVFPVDTPLGRKTQIDQTTCNLDYSCVDGDCPAFMTVEVPPSAGKARANDEVLDGAELPAPPTTDHAGICNIRITGIGGTGVVTISQVVATAGLLGGWYARSLDQTGLAQKGGAVVSDVVLSRTSEVETNKIAAGSCDIYIGGDILVAGDAGNLRVVSPERTKAVLSTSVVPTGRMVSDPEVVLQEPLRIADAISDAFADPPRRLDTRALSRSLFGNDQYANMLLLGAAYQVGGLPLPAAAFEEAIRLNGVAVAQNVQAFNRGRQAIADPAALAQAVASPTAPSPDSMTHAWRYADLVRYQDRAYADQFEETIRTLRARDQEIEEGNERLTEAASKYLYKLMAYKDEYEVARLSLDDKVQHVLTTEFGGAAKASWRLHPPALRALGMQSKLTLGPWFRLVFRVLVAGRRLRGTAFDPFGYAHVRRVERTLLREYMGTLNTVREHVTAHNYETAIELVSLPDIVRGYEEIKLGNVAVYRAALEGLLPKLTGTNRQSPKHRKLP